MRFLRMRAALVGLTLLTVVSISPVWAKQLVISQGAKRVLVAQTSTQVTTYSFPTQDITYSTDGYLNYKGRIFQGNDITTIDSSIGKQVTVTLSHGVDTVQTFTLLLPNGFLQNNEKIKAVGITNNFIAPGRNNDSYIFLRGTVEISNN
jgi:hypothetical protein